jgi:hypothetical protein
MSKIETGFRLCCTSSTPNGTITSENEEVLIIHHVDIGAQAGYLGFSIDYRAGKYSIGCFLIDQFIIVDSSFGQYNTTTATTPTSTSSSTTTTRKISTVCN